MGASGPGRGCFLCPASACTSAGPLAHGPDGPLGVTEKDTQDLTWSAFDFVDVRCTKHDLKGKQVKVKTQQDCAVSEIQ